MEYNGHEPHRHLLEVPIVKPIAVLLGAAIAELLISGTVATLVFGIFYTFGIFNGSNNFQSALAAYIMMWFLGVGLMFLNTALSTVFTAWGKMWYTIQRAAYFLLWHLLYGAKHSWFHPGLPRMEPASGGN